MQFNTWTSERNIVHELSPPAGERGGGAAGCACNKVNKRYLESLEDVASLYFFLT